MKTLRTLAWGTLAAVLVTAAAWAPLPVAGQAPGIGTSAAPEPFTGQALPPGGTSSASDPTTNYPLQAMAGAKQDQINKLAKRYVKENMPEEAKKDIRKKLADAIGFQFDQLATRQQKELEDLERQVADLRTLLKKRHDARDAIIQRRLDQVLQEAEGLGWGTHSAGPRASYVPQYQRAPLPR